MKTGKKAILAIVVLLIVYLFVGLCFMPRENECPASAGADTTDKAALVDGVVLLANAQDSISYAVSMMVARDMPRAIKELEITPATMELFVKGLSDAFPVDTSSKALAYAHGVVVGASAMDMFDEASYAIYQSDTTLKVDRRLFLEGLKAMAYGDHRTMSVDAAYDYYNRIIFRLPSEEFIAKNSSRNGVETLPGGVQVKIERAGTGAVATLDSKVGYIYKASYINGNLVESSRGEVVEAVVGTLLPGLTEVFTTLPVGTKCKAYIPWRLAYGARGSNKVPPYSALVYDIEIVKIVKK